MEILDFSVWENEKHCLVKKSGIWIESFNCVQSESGQMLLWSSRAWRKFICKLHPIFGKNSFFFQFRSRCRIDTEQSLFHLSSCTQTSKMDLSSNILKYTTQTALCILIYFAYVTLELHITKHFCMYSILEAIKYFKKFGRWFFFYLKKWMNWIASICIFEQICFSFELCRKRCSQSTEVFKHFFKWMKNNELYLCKNQWFMEEQVKRKYTKGYILSNYENILSFKQFAKHVPYIDTRGLFKFHKECLWHRRTLHWVLHFARTPGNKWKTKRDI